MKSPLSPLSLLVSCPAGTWLGLLEKQINGQGFTLGYRPSGRGRTLKEVLDKRIPNRLARKYGEIDDLCVSLKILRKGRIIATKNVPRAATGPDFKKIIIGTKGTYGRIVEATLKVFRLPSIQADYRLSWKKPQDRESFLKRFWGSGIRPLMLERQGTQVLKLTLCGKKEMVAVEEGCLKRYAQETRGRIKKVNG